MALSPFHLTIPIDDLPAARRFYQDIFNLAEGRSSEQWVDFNCYNHQLVLHAQVKTPAQQALSTNPVDDYDVPVPHFGMI